MLSFTVALPVSHPAASLSDSQRLAALQAFDAALQNVSSRFSRVAPQLALSFTPSDLQATAIWSGELTRTANRPRFLELELAPALARDLRNRMPDGYPEPRRVRFGPVFASPAIANVWATGLVSTRVEAGDAIGSLATQDLELTFLDATSRAIDPAWCLRLFDALNAWDLPDPTRNPLQPAAPLGLHGASADLGGLNGPSLSLRTANGHSLLIRPAATLNGGRVSFLYSEALTVGLVDAPTGLRWHILVEDRGLGSQHITTPFSSASEVTFVPRDMLPLPAIIGPLRYRITIEYEGSSLPAPPPVEVEQDDIDRLRQEYASRSLEVPPRIRFGYVRKSDRFDESALYKNDGYFENGTRLGLDSDNLPLLTDALSHAFERALHPTGMPASDPRNWMTSDITVLDAYHSPQRHQALTPPPDTNAALYGFYVKLRPRANRQRTVVNRALRTAAIEVLDGLRIQNSGRVFDLLEARLLDQNDALLWTWKLGASGTVTPAPGPGGTTGAPADEDDALSQGRFFELFFAPRDRVNSLVVPPARPKVYAALPVKKRSIILIGDQWDGSPDRIPIDDSSFTLQKWLREHHPDDLDPEVHVVHNPIELLQRIGVVGDRPENFRYVVTMSHAWALGLLLYYPPDEGTPQEDDWPEKYIYSYEVEDQIRDLWELDGNAIGFGPDSVHLYATHQFRDTNLLTLPRDMLRRLRANLSGVDGLMLIGCKTDHEADVPGFLTITEAFANAARVSAWGAPMSSKFWRRDLDGWHPHNEERGQGAPGAADVVLMPMQPGFTWNPGPMTDVDLIGLYRLALKKAIPEPETR